MNGDYYRICKAGSELYHGFVPHLRRLISEKIYRSCSDGRETEVTSPDLYTVLIRCEVVVDYERNGVQSMAGFRLRATVLVMLRLSGLFVYLVHLIRVSVVGGYKSGTVQLVNHAEKARKLKVKSLHRALRRREGAGVPHHIPVRKIDAEVFILPGAQTLYKLIGYLRTLHPRALFKRDDIGGNLYICFELLGEFTGPVTVPEVGYMTEFLCLGDCKLVYSGGDEILCLSIRYLRGIYKIVMRYMEVAVILKHTGIKDIGDALAVEFIKVSPALKRL